MHTLRHLRLKRPASVAVVLLMILPLVTLTSCAPAEENSAPEVAAEPQPAALDPSVLQDPSRPEADHEQDAGRKPIGVYNFLSIQPGMAVADLWAGGGYNTHLLSLLLGDEGKVYAVMGFYGAGRKYDASAQVQERIQSGLTNVTVVGDPVDLSPDSLDAMVAIRNYHDQPTPRDELVRQLYAALKPGGILGIVDVATDRPGWDEETHRLNEKVVIEELTAGGFELVDSSDILSNPEDDHSTTGFETGRHLTDRYLLKFRKPQS